jgi:hypothetical protein
MEGHQSRRRGDVRRAQEGPGVLLTVGVTLGYRPSAIPDLTAVAAAVCCIAANAETQHTHRETI